ncbi:MAG: AfsR/SARP family transcriptional regulator [Longimicrobiales bacterium]
MLDLRAFGTLDARTGRSPLTSILAQPKRAALLAYLVLCRPRGFHRRDTLLAVFWPELDEPRARNALSQALSFLRRELAEDLLVTRGSEEIGIDHARVHCDVVLFEEAVAAGRWSDALDVYGGALLAGFHVSDSAFDAWLDDERQRLNSMAMEAAWSLAHSKVADGALPEAERVAERALRLAPTSERSAREFIQRLAAAGERAAALRFYERFAALLVDELEVEPGPETRALIDAVRRGHLGRVLAARGAGEALTPSVAAPVTAHTAASTELDGQQSASADAQPALETAGAVPIRLTTRGAGRRILSGATAALAVAAVVGLETGAAAPASLLASTPPGQPLVVVVADFAYGDPMLGATASDWLRSVLDAPPELRVPDAAALAEALRRMRRDPLLPLPADVARELAVREGYAGIVTGEIVDRAGGYELTVRLLRAEDSEVLTQLMVVPRGRLRCWKRSTSSPSGCRSASARRPWPATRRDCHASRRHRSTRSWRTPRPAAITLHWIRSPRSRCTSAQSRSTRLLPWRITASAWRGTILRAPPRPTLSAISG